MDEGVKQTRIAKPSYEGGPWQVVILTVRRGARIKVHGRGGSRELALADANAKLDSKIKAFDGNVTDEDNEILPY